MSDKSIPLESIDKRLEELKKKFNTLNMQKSKAIQTLKRLDEELLKTASAYNELMGLKAPKKPVPAPKEETPKPEDTPKDKTGEGKEGEDKETKEETPKEDTPK